MATFVSQADTNHASSQIVRSAHSSARCPEWNFLLQCASRKAHPETAHPTNLDWHRLLPLASQHGVLGLLANYLQSSSTAAIPAPMLPQIQESQRSHAAFTLQLTAELFRVTELLHANGLKVLLTKGPALSIRCYGDPAIRQYGDFDLIVRDKDMARATELMVKLGHQPKIPISAVARGKTPGEYNFTKPGSPVLIEFHTERTFRYHPRPLPIEAVFARSTSLVIDGRSVPVLSFEDELLLICIHGAKHFWERLLWIADVAALSQHPELNWRQVSSAADEVGAQRILHLALQLAADLLGTPIPGPLEEEVRADDGVSTLAASILNRFPESDLQAQSLIERAAFRVRMRGSLLDGFAYLCRLSFSPTEEDWRSDGAAPRSAWLDSLLRPARLARKYRQPKA